MKFYIHSAIPNPTRGKFWLRGICVGIALLWLTAYMIGRGSYMNLSPWLAPFAILLFVAEMHSISHLFGMFYSMWPRRYQTWPELNRSRDLRCNLFICVCGEPPEVLRKTILAAREAARVYNEAIHPHHSAVVTVLNDGKVAKKDNWEEIETMCAELEVRHIARDIKGGFKAGNINNGLQETPTDDPFNTLVVIFDADFCAKPHFLLEITKPFVDATIDFVQSPQRYANEKSWVARAAAAHQIFFFEHICPAKGYDNALFLCGTNFAIRRSALDSIGGMDTEFIIEDYTTSLNLHLTGRKGVFMPEVLAIGMAPSSLKQYFTQQRRWSQGSFDATKYYLRDIVFGPMTWKQKMHYLLSATYYLIGLRDLILMCAPLPYLFFGISLIRPNHPWFMLFIYLPMIVSNFVVYLRMFRAPISSLVLDVVSFPVFTAAFFQSMIGNKIPFIVTIKKYEKENPLRVYKAQTVLGLLLIAGLIYSARYRGFHNFGTYINYWWAFFDAFMLSLGFYLLVRENMNWGVWEADKKRASQHEQAVSQATIPNFANRFEEARLRRSYLGDVFGEYVTQEAANLQPPLPRKKTSDAQQKQ